ncbi:DNA polymerase III subunit gamma and tau [Plantactinospora siamensis]|uniref:DNA-directed DNA polymerase n=1 Tax=Plantactinospora siamensis TaxID=555372 RepID=A0ABV6P643_9ACTN
MALALYRKYRPRTFAEFIGQEHVTEPLSAALRSGRLHHAYLFSGPRGCGKTSSARILARSLNCEQGPTPEPCGVCESCRSLANDGAGSIDVIEIDAASHGGVDDARELRERAFFAPASSRFKIYIIDEAHMVSSAGFNALLKLVEEPPDYVKFIFATTEPEKVLGTIRSRTHHYPFRLFPPKVVRPYLEQLCQAEGVTVEPAVFPLVVRAGGGSMRDSLSVLDQLIGGAGAEGVSYARAAALLGVTDSALIDEMCDALAAGDGAAAYAAIDRIVEAGHDPRRFAADLLERLRDLIVLQQVPDAAAKGLIDGPADQLERMAAQAQRLGPGTLSRCADIVHNGLVDMRGTTAPRLLLELICARMLLPGADDSTAGLLQRLERMERRLTLAGPAPEPAAGPPRPATAPEVPAADRPAADRPSADRLGEVAAPPAPTADGSRSVAPAPPVPPAAGADPTPAAPEPVRAAAAAPPAQPGPPASARPVSPAAVMPDPATPDPIAEPAGSGGLDAAAVRRVWTEVVAMVNRSNKRIAALVRDATVRDLDGETVVLTFRYPVHAQMVAGQAEVLADALYEQLGGRWQVRCEVAGDQRSTPPRTPAPTAGSRSDAAPRPDAAPTAGPRADANGGRSGQDDAAAVRSEPANGRTPAGAARPRAAGGGGPAPAPPAAAEEDDWPTPARPGGTAAGEAARGAAGPDGAAGGDAAPAGAEPAADDWPAPARPGGGGEPASPAPDGPGTVAAAGAPVERTGGGISVARAAAAGSRGADVARPTAPGGDLARPTAAGAAATRPVSGGRAAPGAADRPVSGGLAAARAAAAGRGPRPAGRGAGRAAPTAVAEQEWAGEPPYDPEYDGPPRAGGGYVGFDPGDEPLDEVVDEQTARQTSEQQAVQLLQQAFSAERIGEVEAR